MDIEASLRYEQLVTDTRRVRERLLQLCRSQGTTPDFLKGSILFAAFQELHDAVGPDCQNLIRISRKICQEYPGVAKQILNINPLKP